MFLLKNNEVTLAYIAKSFCVMCFENSISNNGSKCLLKFQLEISGFYLILYVLYDCSVIFILSVICNLKLLGRPKAQRH